MSNRCVSPADEAVPAGVRRVENRVADPEDGPPFIPSPETDRSPAAAASRWQGLERKVFVVVHPLSGVTRPSAFDLETGRLCVRASRHKAGLVVVGRDHILDTLEEHLPTAEQALGRPDIAGRGHRQNLGFWRTLLEGDKIVG